MKSIMDILLAQNFVVCHKIWVPYRFKKAILDIF